MGNWRAVCEETRMHGSERGGEKRAGRDTTRSAWQVNSTSQYLACHLLYYTCAAKPLPQPWHLGSDKRGEVGTSHFSQDDTKGGELLYRNDPLAVCCSLLMSCSGLVLTRDFLQRALIWLREGEDGQQETSQRNHCRDCHCPWQVEGGQ
jgi:hypothetical protein